MLCLHPGPEGQYETCNDGDIGQVENWPPANLDKVDNLAVADNIHHISRGSAERESQSVSGKVALKARSGVLQDDRGN